jgi:hypothetical protein
MTPAEPTRCWRKSLRRTRRGIPTGRRATHSVQTTYGQQQRDRDHRLTWLWLTARAEMEADLNARSVTAA